MPHVEHQITEPAKPSQVLAFETIGALRDAYSAADGDASESLVGGRDATALDTQSASERDQALIIPIILAIVFLILALLLRSLVAPVLLIASVLATFFASLGAANLLFRGVEVGAGHHRVEFKFDPLSFDNLLAAAAEVVAGETEETQSMALSQAH